MKLTRRRKATSPPRYLTDAPRTWLLLASRASTAAGFAEEIRDLAGAKHVVRLGYGAGRLPRGMPRGRHRLGTFRLLPTRLATTLLTLPLRVEKKLELAARHDRWLVEVAGVADEVVFLDEAAAEQLGDRVRTLAPGARFWAPELAARVLAEEAAWRSLTVGARELDGRLPGHRITLSRVLAPAEKLQELAEVAPLREDLARDVRPQLRRLARWALRRGGFDRVDALLAVTDLMRAQFGPLAREDRAAAALRAHVALVHDATPEIDVVDLVRDVLAEADAALVADDLKESSELAAIGLGLLFHQQLHTACARTPLVEDTDTFLAPLRESRVGQLLASPDAVPLGPEALALEETEGEDAAGLDHEDGAATTPAEAGAVGGVTDGTAYPPGEPDLMADRRRVRVSMLPGVYANHAAPVLAALEADDRVELTAVRPSTVAFRGMMIDAPVLQYRLEHALRRVPTVGLQVSREEYDAVTGADVVVADWADKGAVWASTVVPEGVRMVVRVHSVDVLSAPAQLVDWSRVDDIVFVADHIRDLFVGIMGARVAHARLHVVTNIVPLAGFPDPLLPDASRTLGLVGWAQVVKDPDFALDVLEHLLEHDDRWRLRLIGPDFGEHHATRPTTYARDFRSRVLETHLVDRIDYTGYTREMAGHLRHVGYILSTSLREGCPVGVLEGVAAGAVPVVRDWPAFARLRGARRLFPDWCVVDDAEEAARLILSSSDPADRDRAATRVVEEMDEQFSEAGTRDRLLQIILGPAAA